MKFVAPMALICALTISGELKAADDEGRFALRSFATLSCSQVIDVITRNEGDEFKTIVSQFSAWIGGYLTHANRATANTYDIVPFAADRDVLAVVVNRCEQVDPETNFEAITASVVSILASFSVESESPIKLSEDFLPLRESTIVTVQEQLIKLDFLSGTADGVVGPATLSALKEFQESRSAENPDFLDIDGLLALLRQ